MSLIGQAILEQQEDEAREQAELQEMYEQHDYLEQCYTQHAEELQEAVQQQALESYYKRTVITLAALKRVEKIVSATVSTESSEFSDTKLPASRRVMNAGKSYAQNLPDGSQDISFVEKLAAKILGSLGLSNTGLSVESLPLLTAAEKKALFLKSLGTHISKIEKAVESIREDLDPDFVEDIEQKLDECFQNNGNIQASDDTPVDPDLQG